MILLTIVVFKTCSVMKHYFLKMTSLGFVVSALCLGACGNPPASTKSEEPRESTYLKKSVDKAKEVSASAADLVAEGESEVSKTAGE